MKNLFALVVVLVATAAAPAFGEGPLYQLDVEGATPGKEIVVSRPPDGLVPVQVVLNPPAKQAGQPVQPGQPVRVSMSQFAGDRGSFAVQIRAACDSAEGVQSLDFAKSGMQGICLYIPALPGDGRYTGSMLLIPPDSQPLVKPFVITRPQAVLTVQPIAPQLVTLPFWDSGSPADPQQTFRVVLSEKSGTADASGIMVKLAVSKSPANFDLEKNIAFRIRNKEVPDLESGPSTNSNQTDLRTVRAGGQLGIDVALYGLKPGEYNAVLQFSSPNSAADDSQKQNLVIQVRSSIWWAVVCLIAAAFFSFVATKVLAGLRWRASLQRQIHDLKPQWLGRLPRILAVVWVGAVLHQAKKLSSRFWLTGTDLIDSQVGSVRSMLKLLDQARQLHDLLTRTLDDFILRRVVIGLENVESRLEAGAPDDATAACVQADLKKFEDWLATDKILDKFQDDVIPDVSKLLRDVAADPAASALPQIKELVARIGAELTPLPADTAKMSDLYRHYALLRVLWAARKNPAELAKELAVYPDLTEVLRVADEWDWERLQGAKLKLRLPESASPEGLEAYVPLQFSVEHDDEKDAGLTQSYLFKHKVDFAWTFTLTPVRGFWETIHMLPQPHEVTLRPVTRGPSVVQYFPCGGQLRVQVDLHYYGQPRTGLHHEGLAIQNSSEFGFLSMFEKAEVISWLIAVSAAIATGLSTFYFKGPAFGSFQDYLSLFVWGAGIDQTKNFVQNIQASSTVPPSQTH
jgi:hypothetical protein